jgi:hypothetical protein
MHIIKVGTRKKIVFSVPFINRTNDGYKFKSNAEQWG